MKDKLVLEEYHSGSYSIMWYIAEYQELGGELGSGFHEDNDISKAKPEDRECAAAELALQQWAKEHKDEEFDTWRHEDHAVRFHTKAAAADALRYVKNAMKVILDRVPWPDWASTALKHGWKPPRGWKP